MASQSFCAFPEVLETGLYLNAPFFKLLTFSNHIFKPNKCPCYTVAKVVDKIIKSGTDKVRMSYHKEHIVSQLCVDVYHSWRNKHKTLRIFETKTTFLDFI